MNKNIEHCYQQLAEYGALMNEPMAQHTTFKLGGEADVFFEPRNRDELMLALQLAKENVVPLFVMGNGSNILVSDRGVEGLVISLTEMVQQVSFPETCLMEVSAAVPFPIAVKRSVEAGYMGMEWGAGIPGTVGGAIAMNAGAYGGDISSVVKWVEYIQITENGVAHMRVEPEPGSFGYRHSAFSFPDVVVLSAAFALAQDDGSAKQRMNDYTQRRIEKQPLNFPSAGSTFKRPEGHFAGQLIEQAGLKGFSVGGAQVSEKHAGFVINTGAATADDVLNLIEEIKKRVYKASGVTLEEEVRFIGRR